MNSQLVGAAGHRFEFEQGFTGQSLSHPKICDGVFAVRFDVPESRFREASDGGVNRSRRFINDSFNDREISFFNQFSLKMLA